MVCKDTTLLTYRHYASPEQTKQDQHQETLEAAAGDKGQCGEIPVDYRSGLGYIFHICAYKRGFQDEFVMI